MKTGRPKSKPADAKSCYVRVRVTKAERAKILRNSKASDEKTESAWIRKRLLGDD